MISNDHYISTSDYPLYEIIYPPKHNLDLIKACDLNPHQTACDQDKDPQVMNTRFIDNDDEYIEMSTVVAPPTYDKLYKHSVSML